MKTCSKCKEELPLSSFTKHSKNKDGLQGSCQECNKRSSKEWNANNKDSLILKRLKERSIQKGLDFDLTVTDINVPLKCPVFGFNLQRNHKVPLFNSPSVDRIDPTKGYTKDNVQIISQLANAMKQNATPKQLLQFARWILNTYEKEENENIVHP
jgi:hypothetical protein